MHKRLVLFVALCACALNVSAKDDPLFQEDSILEINLAAPFRQIRDERDKDASYPAQLTHTGTIYDVEIQVRGNKRLSERTCFYPPLRIDFEKKDIDETLFDHQNDIKLVVQCKSGSTYEGYLRTEFLIYKAFNLLTNASYRARWANVHYTDTKDPDDIRTAPAFFVERKSRLAKRLDLDTSDVMTIGIEELVAEDAALVDLFQYIIANPDYSIRAAPPGEECCHNAKILSRKDKLYVPVIYDFDSSGAINARYAFPNPSLGIRRVTQRLYRGYCEHNDATAVARSVILSKRDEILALFDNDPLLDDRPKKSTVKFLTRSFEDLESDKRFQSEIIGECR